MSESSQLESPPRCPFITFYSFKGGVGRSMAVINVASIVAARGFRVLVVDMDLEAPGLSFLANQPAPGRQSLSPRLGLVDFLLDAVERGPEADLFCLSPSDAVDRYSALFPLPEEHSESNDGALHIMPAGRLDEGYAERFDRLDLPGLYRDGTGLALIQAFKQVVQASERFDYVFVDSRTGFSDESGICTRDLADALMVVSGLNNQNVEGTSRFLSSLRAAKPEKIPLAVILSPIPNGEDALVDERERHAGLVFSEAWGESVSTDLHIPYHPQLALTEEPHIFRRRKGYLFDAYNRIEQRLRVVIGDTLEDRIERVKEAVSAKEFGRALVELRQAGRLAGGPGWADPLVFETSFDEVDGDPGEEAFFGALVGQVTDGARQTLARMAHGAAVRASKANSIDSAEVLFRRAILAVPLGESILGTYAPFPRSKGLKRSRARLIFSSAATTEPWEASIFSNYAIFKHVYRRDLSGAEQLYRRAIELDPSDVNSLANCANICLETGRVSMGLDLAARAVVVLEGVADPTAVDAECWMYVYCCDSPTRRALALRRLNTLVHEHRINTKTWDFSGVIAVAVDMGHPEAEWLPRLADVLAHREPSSILEPWAAWKAAASQGEDEGG